MMQPALVEWEDTMSGEDHWQTYEALHNEVGIGFTLGFVEEIDEGFRVIGTIMNRQEVEPCFGAVWMIPKGCIRRITYLSSRAVPARWAKCLESIPV